MIAADRVGKLESEPAPVTLDMLAQTLGELAKEIEREEIVEGGSAELVSELLARADPGELVLAFVAHAERTDMIIDGAALAAAVAANAEGVWGELVRQLMARGGVDALAHELRLCAGQVRDKAIRARVTSWPLRRLVEGGLP